MTLRNWRVLCANDRHLNRTIEALIIAAVALVVAAIYPARTQAQPSDDWVGKRVVQKTSRFELWLISGAKKKSSDASDIGSPFDALSPPSPTGGGTAKKRATPKVSPQPVSALDMRTKKKKLTTPIDVPMFYSVVERDGDWLLLSSQSEDEMGWVQSDNVVVVDKAIEFFTNQLRANPKDDFSFAMRGLAHEDKKEIDAALDDYSRSIALDSRSIFPFVARARIWSRKQEYDKAIADYGQAIKLDPQVANLFSKRAAAWSKKKEYDKAIADLTEAIQLDPRNAELYRKRAIAWLEKGEPDKALRDCEEIARKEFSLEFPAAILDSLRFETEQFDKAIAHFTFVIGRDPNKASAYRDRGIAWYRKDEYDKALDDFDRSIKLDPGNASLDSHAPFSP